MVEWYNMVKSRIIYHWPKALWKIPALHLPINQGETKALHRKNINHTVIIPYSILLYYSNYKETSVKETQLTFFSLKTLRILCTTRVKITTHLTPCINYSRQFHVHYCTHELCRKQRSSFKLISLQSSINRLVWRPEYYFKDLTWVLSPLQK